MSTTRTIQLDVDTKSAVKSVKDLENELSNLAGETIELTQINQEFKQELLDLEIQFDKIPKTALSARKQIGGQIENLKNAIKENNLALEDFTIKKRQKTKIIKDLKDVEKSATTVGQTIGTALTASTSGFAVVQGAMGLLGTESEDLEKALLKVQSAIAIQQGVQGVKEAIPAFKQLGQSAMTALKGIKTGIAATGIGLFVVAVGAVVANFDKIKEAISGVSDEQEKLNVETEKNVLAAKENLETLNGQENILKLQGKSEREILKLKMAATDEAITASIIQIEQMEQTKKAQIEAAQRNKDIAQGIIAFLSAPIVILLGAVDALTDGLSKIGVLSEGTNLAQGFTEGAANLLFDPEETAAEADEEINVAKKALQELKNNRAGFELQIQAIDTKGAKKSVDTEKKRLDDIKKLQDDAFDQMVKEEKDLQETFDKIKRENEDRFRTEEENELLLVEEKYDRLKAMAQDNAEALEQIEIARLNELNDINLKFGLKAQEQQDLLDAQAAAKQKAIDDKKSSDAQELADYQLQVAHQSLTAISDIAELFSKGNEKQAKRAFQIQKAVGIAQATINTAQAITKVFAETTDFTPTQSLRVANAVAIGLAGAAQVASIASQQFQGGGTGGTDVSVDTTTQAPSFNVVGDSGVNQLAQLQQQPTQAFVVSGEVTTAQALDRNRVQNATL